jgi:hypothetical protein
MKESYGEGIATHTGPELCGAAREGGVEALTGERAGQVFKGSIRSADIAGAPGSRAVTDPVHVRKHLVSEPGDPVFTRSRKACAAHREV